MTFKLESRSDTPISEAFAEVTQLGGGATAPQTSIQPEQAELWSDTSLRLKAKNICGTIWNFGSVCTVFPAECRNEEGCPENRVPLTVQFGGFLSESITTTLFDSPPVMEAH